MDSKEQKELEIVNLLTNAGSLLLHHPSSPNGLFRSLEEVEIILCKVDSRPSATIKEALLPLLKELVSDRILKNSDSDIKVAVASCFDELMRITAPDSPYDDFRMKDIFELIVYAFDKLSLLSGVSYHKALSIIRNAAKLGFCVMMMEIKCYDLIIEMFEQFKRNLSSAHPTYVFTAMENIMSHIIDESDDIPSELLKVVLDCVRKENENTSLLARTLGAKIIERTCQKFKPFLRDAIKSGNVKKEDYAPIIESILQADSEIMEQNHISDSTNQSVAKPSLADVSTIIDAASTSVNAPAIGLSVDSPAIPLTVDSPAIGLIIDVGTRDGDLIDNRKPFKAPGLSNLSNVSDNAETKSETQTGSEIAFHNPEKPLVRPRGRPRKSCPVVFESEITSDDGFPVKFKDLRTIYEETEHLAVSVDSSHSGKKLGRPRKDAAGGSVNKGSSEKEKNVMDDIGKKMLRSKRGQMKEEVFHTPFGMMQYKEDIVGCSIQVWWPKDKEFYEGRIASYDSATGKHRVEYEDGDVENLTLVNENFEFIGDEIADIKPKVSSD